ncbi:MAG: sigma-70 family RNA polymerase sigma factor [Phycisphaerales bacterium]|nr:MAG: sigma-70 family RNA polymerase sigma factor [Phycisphaerales bacterium]
MHHADRKALEALHARHYHATLKYVAARVGYGAHAEDITQDVFVEICRGTSKYNGSTNVQRYLHGVAKNLVRKYRLNRTNSVKIIDPGLLEKLATTTGDNLLSTKVGRMSASQLRALIEERVAQLPPKAREAIKLRFIEGLKSPEAAKKAGCSVKTFYDRVGYGIRAFRKLNGQSDEKSRGRKKKIDS